MRQVAGGLNEVRSGGVLERGGKALADLSITGES